MDERLINIEPELIPQRIPVTTTWTHGYVTPTGDVIDSATADHVYSEAISVKEGDVIRVSDSAVLRYVTAYNGETVESEKGYNANLWGEDWEGGSINQNTGENSTNADRIRTKGYISVSPNTVYRIQRDDSAVVLMRYYDPNQAYLGAFDANNAGDITASEADATRKTPSGCYYMRMAFDGTDYDSQLCVYSQTTNEYVVPAGVTSIILTALLESDQSVTRERGVEGIVEVISEPFSFGSTPSVERAVSLNMRDGDQVVTPSAGYLMSKVTIRKPAALKSSNIKSYVTIGGVIGSYQGETLPPVDNPVVPTDVLAGKEFLVRVTDHIAIKGAGTLQTYDGTVNLDMSNGDQVVTAASGSLLSSVTIKKPLTLVPEVIKKNIPIGGVVGSLDPDAFEHPLLNVYHTAVTVASNSANTVSAIKDYLYSLLGITETNRLFAAALRATSGFVNTEVGRIVQYPNSNNWSIVLYSTTTTAQSKWVTGNMNSSAVIQIGRVYDLYWWQVPANPPQ